LRIQCLGLVHRSVSIVTIRRHQEAEPED
jgi:hypothetical protein